MSDLHSVDPEGWEYDLQSIYSAYMGHFQLHGIRWDDRAWGRFFESFEQFLTFSWPVITVTDARTGRAHLVTCMASLIAFLKMIKTRFGETLPQVDNMLVIKSVETAQRQLWHVKDQASYERLYSVLPAVALTALKTRVRGGDPNMIRKLWAFRDKTFLAIDFEFLERNDRPCVEWGYAAIRSNHLEAAGAWPPVPDTNYRKGHYIVSEYAETFSKASPSISWQFGESQVIPRTNVPRIIRSVLSGLLSPDSEMVANNVVLVGHGIKVVVQHLEDMKIELPKNLITLDIAYLERALFRSGERGQMRDRKTGKARLPESLLSLNGLLHSVGLDPPCTMHNAGNDSFMTLAAFQRLVDPTAVVVVTPKSEVLGKDGVRNGHGPVKRVTSAASRIFRPLSVVHPHPESVTRRGTHAGAKENGHVHGHGHGNVNGNGLRHANGTVPHLRPDEHRGGADEMGMRRASMFSILSSSVLMPAEKTKKVGGTVNGGSTKGHRASVDLKSGWSSPSTATVGPDRMPQGIVEKRW